MVSDLAVLLPVLGGAMIHVARNIYVSQYTHAIRYMSSFYYHSRVQILLEILAKC